RFSALSTAYLQLTPAPFAEQVSVAFCRPGLPLLDRPERRFRGSCPLFRRSGCPEPHTKGKHGSNLSSKPTASLSGCHPSHAGHSIKASAQDLSRLQSRTGCAFSLSASGIRPPNLPGDRNSFSGRSGQPCYPCYLRNSERRRIDLEARTHRRADRHLLDVVALGAGRLGLRHGIGEGAHVLFQGLEVERNLANAGMDDSGLLDAELDSTAL